MTPDSSSPSDLDGLQGLDQESLDEIVAGYVDRLNAGEMLDQGKIREECPALAEEVWGRLKVFQRVGGSAEAALGTLGDYTLRRQIGRGGMGVVYEAWESSMNRRVALKVLPAGIAADPRALTRFVREAQVAGNLHHVNVVPVYGMGVKEKTPFFSMEYIDGETLAQILARRRAGDPGEVPSPEDCYRTAGRFAEVADGLQHAHTQGVVHRDLKPSNLILDREGRLRILDFGLARLDGQETITASGDFLGTPQYMSPEQARRRKVPVDHRTDIYSLGATLYEVLTWRPPFQGKDREDTLSQIIERDPLELHKLNPRVPGDLETIILKCLRKDPADRYGTAEALGQDLRRFVRGDPIEARPRTALEGFVRKVARNRRRLLWWTTVFTLCTLSAALLSVIWFDRRTARHREYQEEIVLQKLKLLRCQTTLEAAAGSSKQLDSQGFFVFSDFERLVTDAALAEVIEALGALARKAPERFEAHYYLAQALRLSGRPEEARVHLERALARAPSFPPAVVLEAELAGEKLDVERLRQSVARERGADWKSGWLLAHLARSEGRPADAARAYGRLIALDREGKITPGFSIDLRLARGLARLEARDFRGAADDFIVARDLWPESLEPGLLLGKAYSLDGDAAWAEDAFEKLHREAASPDEAAAWIAVVHLSLGDHFQALRWARRVEEPVIQRRLRGWCLLTLFGGDSSSAEEDRRQRALAAAWQALSLDPHDIDAMFTAAFSMFWSPVERSEEEKDEVVGLCEEAIALDRENGPAHGLLTVVALVRGETSRALELVRKVRRIAERDPLINFLEDYTLWALGRNAELAEALEAQEAAGVTRHERAYRMGCQAEILAREGKHREAIAMYEKALEIDPGRPWLENFKCMRVFQLGEYERAVECYGELASRGVDLYVRSLAEVLVALGRPGEAVSAVCAALVAKPWKPAKEDLPRLVREHGDDVLPRDLASLVQSFEEASRTAAANPPLLHALAFLRLHGPEVHDLVKAREAISRALEMPGEPDAEALAILAEIFHAEGNREAAIRKLEDALRLSGASRAHRRLLDRWREEALPELPSYGSIEAALAARRPGSVEDLDLVRSFPRDPGDTAAERRFAYLEACVLARSGRAADAVAKLAPLAEGLEASDFEPHLRLSECLVASGAAEAAEAHLRRVLEEGGEAPPEIWNSWLDVSLSSLAWSPRDCLARMPAREERKGDDHAAEIRWLLEELSSTGAVRIDCAATEERSSPSGLRWGRDRFCLGGSANVWAGGPEGRPAVRGSDDEQLYKFSRWFEPDEDRPGYAIPLPRGRYTVTLHFCEGWSAAPGLRVFEVVIEGETRLDGYDGFARAGFGVAASESFDVAVEDGLLEIELRARKGGADVAAIEVRPIR